MTFFMHLKRPCGCILYEEIRVKDEAEAQAIFERMVTEPCEDCVEKAIGIMMYPVVTAKEEANC